MTLFWLSFADAHRPRGSQFLGVAIVEAANFKAAIDVAWKLGCNPGGECRGFSLHPAATPVPPEYRHRVLDKAEIGELEAIGRVQ